jgi:hypothetical protein
MDQEELDLFVQMTEIDLRQSEQHIALAKMLVSLCKQSQEQHRVFLLLHRLPDCQDKRDIIAQLVANDAQSPVRAALQLLQDVLARAESDHEKLEAFQATLRASSSPPPPAEG